MRAVQSGWKVSGAKIWTVEFVCRTGQASETFVTNELPELLPQEGRVQPRRGGHVEQKNAITRTLSHVPEATTFQLTGHDADYSFQASQSIDAFRTSGISCVVQMKYFTSYITSTEGQVDGGD